jgi:hypothetical protein
VDVVLGLTFLDFIGGELEFEPELGLELLRHEVVPEEALVVGPKIRAYHQGDKGVFVHV